MCESLLKLRPNNSSHIELETTIRYASAVTNRIGIKKVTKFNDLHFSILQEISKIYRDKTVIEDMVLNGFVNFSTQILRIMGGEVHAVDYQSLLF